jgi:hypothetical protein
MIPWLVISGAYAEIGLARLLLKRWPVPITDDPKLVAIEPLHLLVMLLFVSLAGVAPLIVILSVWNWRTFRSDWRYSANIGVLAAGVLTLWLLVSHDPGNVWYWFLD